MVRSGSAAILVRAKAVSALPLAGIVVALALLVAPCIAPLLIWNASPSVAVGLYRVDQAIIVSAILSRFGYIRRSRPWPPGEDISPIPPIFSSRLSPSRAIVSADWALTFPSVGG